MIAKMVFLRNSDKIRLAGNVYLCLGMDYCDVRSFRDKHYCIYDILICSQKDDSVNNFDRTYKYFSFS